MHEYKDNKLIVKKKCKYCFKQFIKKSNYDKHMLVCEKKKQKEIILNIKNEEDSIALLSRKQMMNMIYTLNDNVNKLNRRVKNLEDLKKMMMKEKKKINIIDWLNNPLYTTKVFNDYFQDIKNYEITYNHIKKVNDIGFIEGINYIMLDIFKLEYNDKHSIRCFTMNSNMFYINTINKEDILEWRLFTESDLNKTIQIIKSKLWLELSKYKNEHREILEKNDTLYTEYINMVSTVMGDKYNEDENKSRCMRNIKKLLFEYLKRDIKKITLIEATF